MNQYDYSNLATYAALSRIERETYSRKNESASRPADFFCVSTDYLLTGQEKQNTAENEFVIDPLRNIQQQASTLLDQTNYLITTLEAKK